MSPETEEQINRMITKSKFKGPRLKLGKNQYFDLTLKRSEPGIYKVFANMSYSDKFLTDLSLCRSLYEEKAEELLNQHDGIILDLFDDGAKAIEDRTVNPIFFSYQHILDKVLYLNQIEVVGAYSDDELVYWINLIGQEVEKICKLNPENRTKKINRVEVK